MCARAQTCMPAHNYCVVLYSLNFFSLCLLYLEEDPFLFLVQQVLDRVCTLQIDIVRVSVVVVVVFV